MAVPKKIHHPEKQRIQRAKEMRTLLRIKGRKIFGTTADVVHGDDRVCDEFARTLTDSGYIASAPYSGTVFDVIRGEFLTQAEPVALKKKTAAKKRADDMFQRLITAGQRLIGVIRKNEGLSNKDTAKFTAQIHALCDKWDRDK